MRRAGCEEEILRALAAMPFIDRMDLAAGSGWSRGAVYEAVARLDRGGFCDAISHATDLFPATERFSTSPPPDWSGWPPRKRCPWTSCSAPTQSRPDGGAS